MDLMCELGSRSSEQFSQTDNSSVPTDDNTEEEEEEEYDSNQNVDISFMFVSLTDLYNDLTDTHSSNTSDTQFSTHTNSSQQLQPLERLAGTIDINSGALCCDSCHSTRSQHESVVSQVNIDVADTVEELDVSDVISEEKCKSVLDETKVVRDERNAPDSVSLPVPVEQYRTAVLSVVELSNNDTYSAEIPARPPADHLPKPESGPDCFLPTASARILGRSNRKLRNKGRVRREGKWKKDESSTGFRHSKLSERTFRLIHGVEESEVEELEAEYELFRESLRREGGRGVEEEDEGQGETERDSERDSHTDRDTGTEKCNETEREIKCDMEENKATDNGYYGQAQTSSDITNDTTTLINTVPSSETSETFTHTQNNTKHVNQKNIDSTKEKKLSCRGRQRKTNKDTSLTTSKTFTAHSSNISTARDMHRIESASDLICPYEALFTASLLGSIPRLLSSVQTIERNIALGGISRNKKKWRVKKAREQVKTKHCRRLTNNIHGRGYYVHHRVYKLMPLPPRELPIYSRPRTAHIDRETARSLRTAEPSSSAPWADRSNQRRGRAPVVPPTTENPAVRRNAASAQNADSDLPTDILNILIALQDRDLSPEDYELLLRLDERVKPKTLTRIELDRLRVEVLEEGFVPEDLCTVCQERYVLGQRVKCLPCSHRFHAGCIDDWLSNSSTCCPLDGVEVDL